MSRNIFHAAFVGGGGLTPRLAVLTYTAANFHLWGAAMLNATSLLADALAQNLSGTFRRIYADREPLMAALLDEAARLVIERIGCSGTRRIYHDCEHTVLVTLCVQDILRGRRMERTVSPSDWGHTILAALNHDIGYVRGICAGDTVDHFVIDAAGHTVAPPRGASDAYLTPHHVERGKIKVLERFAAVPVYRRKAHRRRHRAHPVSGARR